LKCLQGQANNSKHPFNGNLTKIKGILTENSQSARATALTPSSCSKFFGLFIKRLTRVWFK